MNKKLVAANWKMNLSFEQATRLTLDIKDQTLAGGAQVMLATPAPYIPIVAQILKETKIEYGAQNVHWAQSGAFTGELSVPMLRQFGCSFSLVGHSERRHVCGESIELCVKRAAGAMAQKLTVIFCVGETLEERESGRTNSILSAQLSPLLRELSHLGSSSNLILAYEPVWAIGTGKVAAAEDIRSAHEWIESLVKSELGIPRPILYGGSVTPDNFGEILEVQGVSGGLIGGASLDFQKFNQLLQIAERL